MRRINMGIKLMHSSISLLLLITQIAIAAPPLAKNDCREYCGNVSIPYPFGIGTGCFFDRSFEISCDNSSSPPRIWLSSIQMEVLEISIEWGSDYNSRSSSNQYIRVKSPIISQNCPDRETSNGVNFTGSPFYYYSYDNTFVAMGCDMRALLAGTDPEIVGCRLGCTGSYNRTCEATIPTYLQLFNVTFENETKQAEVESESRSCKLAFLAEQNWFNDNISDPSTVNSMTYVPAKLSWGIPNKTFDLPERDDIYRCGDNQLNLTWCYCLFGYEGNPFLPTGCQDIDECEDPKLNRCDKGTCVNTPGTYKCEARKRKNFWLALGISLGVGVLLLFISGWGLFKFLKKRRKIKLKKKYFKQNGGLLLQQQLFSTNGDIQRAKLFDSKDLKKATDNFNKNRILGQGGQGTVYKGMLVDGRIVAVKKSIVVDADKVEEFINEVFILSQINHRNVVKLLGCCLETEVPLLVYEFISNGTLFQYLHDQNEEFQLSWEMRLRIAIEVAEALSYLHSSASFPIYHRDIKSTNILLDEKYRAKVSDFGTSRSLAIDKTHLTTNVQGTFGYLDPEYFQSSQFSDKSDVYSFGVVLVELITAEKPTSIVRIGEGRSLTTHFILSMKENRLFDIVDPRIMQDSVHEEIMAAAKLAYRCLSLSGKKRPTMREVAVELERIPSLQKASNVQQTHGEVENVITDISYIWDAASTSTGLTFDTGAASSLEIESLFYSQKM
ncbi:hypothetical protein PTKIN_Ptkin12aG0045800 [Pterospermum kingtungense]